jgi:tetratricopeptide (TPR) repeat protein
MSPGGSSVPVDRVVAVVAALRDGREQLGSGYLAGGRLVLTAEHCTRDKVTGEPAARLRVVCAADGAVADVIGVVADRGLDVAVLQLAGDAPWEAVLPPLVFARVDQSRSGMLEDCAGIGFPLFQRDPGRGARHTSEFHGTVYQTDERESGRLLMREPLIHPGPVTAAGGETLAGPGEGGPSPWGGLSGALMFYRGRAIGVVVEHHPRQGDSALRAVGFERIAAASAEIRQCLGLPWPDGLPDASGHVQASGVWAELAAPAGLSNLPRPGLFVGRAGELARLDAALAGPGQVVVQAVHGLGGVGKSTLAARWAADHAGDYLVTWWITAATPADIDAGLAGLAVALAPALSGVLPLEALRGGAVQWLAAHRGWLVILDNVSDPADVAPLLARARAGRYLITSRRASGWHAAGAATVRLDVLEAAEAQALLAAILGRPGEADGAAGLCAELGFLPLAIEQAGAYLAQAGATPAEYLALLARYPAAMYQAAAEGGDAARTIARIWRVTVDRLAGDPLAGRVLRILAWYAPDGIPRALLDGLADPPAVLGAVGRLAAYSMLTADGGTLAMHRLVQAVTRTPDPDDPHRDPQAIDAARDQASRQLADALPDVLDPAAWPRWRMLLPHIDALASHAPPDTDTQDTARLLNEAGLFLGGQGQPGRAARYLQRALAGCVRVLGADHPDTLTSRNNLAGAYESAGDLGRAIPLHEQTLADSVRVLGADHPATLISRNNLAYAYESAGDLGRAIPLHEQTLADSVRVLGADHPQTLLSRNNLAYAYESAGDLGRAIPLYEQTLADRVRVLGADHPQTKTVRGNLAAARQHPQ